MVDLAKLKSDVLLLMSLEANHLDGVDLVCSSHVLLMLLQPMIRINHPTMELDQSPKSIWHHAWGLIVKVYVQASGTEARF